MRELVELESGERELIQLIRDAATEGEVNIGVLIRTGKFIVLTRFDNGLQLTGEGPSFELAWADVAPEYCEPEPPMSANVPRLSPRLRIIEG